MEFFILEYLKWLYDLIEEIAPPRVKIDRVSTHLNALLLKS